MLWRLAVASVSLLGFLGGATLLTHQLQQDVAGGFGDFDFSRLGSIDPGPPDGVKPFRFDDLTLPNNIPLTIPEGAVVNPDGSITLPDGTKIPIDGATFKDIDITLPKDGSLSLPDDAFLDGSKLNCPSGCDINIPDVGEFKVPPGASMDLPPDILDKLAQNGYSGSNLPSDLRLPQGTDLTIPQMTVPEGDFTAQDGTRLVPPTGSSFNLPQGTITDPQSINLPAGTQIDQTSALGLLAGIGYVAATQGGLTDADLPPELSDEPSSDSTSRAVTYVEALGAVKKGSPFTAAGFVRDTSGNGLPGVVVLIYVNQTESTPGTYVGTSTTGADGTFSQSLTLPSSLPAGQYILMANSQPTRVNGVLYGGAWG